jgi:YgiT-type zinc finger domain-containing protein
MKATETCPVCSGKLVKKEVEKFVKGNGDTAVLKIKAEVCLHCGMRFYPPAVIARFAEVKRKLEKGQTKSFVLTGKSYKVA